MDWLLSPTHYMVELVPTKQNGTSGRVMEVSLFNCNQNCETCF